MPGPSFIRRILGAGVLSGLLLGSAGIASAATTVDPAPSQDTAASSESSGGWGPIVGACLGVLFGGAIAIWQIRGMKDRR
ncbi:MAG: hypothetical protein AAGF11_07140 [Myxococcota bacterium]